MVQKRYSLSGQRNSQRQHNGQDEDDHTAAENEHFLWHAVRQNPRGARVFSNRALAAATHLNLPATRAPCGQPFGT